MTFRELEAACGESLAPAQWREHANADGTRGWHGEGAAVDPTAHIDPSSIVRGEGTEIGRRAVIGPDVVVENGARIADGAVLRDGVEIAGPVTISGAETLITGPDTRVWWLAALAARQDENERAEIIDSEISGGTHISGRVAIGISTIKDGSRIKGDHDFGTERTEIVDCRLADATVPPGLHLLSEEYGPSHAGGENEPAPQPAQVFLLLRRDGSEEAVTPPPRRHAPHAGFQRCSHRGDVLPFRRDGQEKH